MTSTNSVIRSGYHSVLRAMRPESVRRRLRAAAFSSADFSCFSFFSFFPFFSGGFADGAGAPSPSDGAGTAGADASAAGDGKASELSEEEKKFTFQYQSPAKKLVIALAGPVSNYLFAILIFAGIFFFLGKINFPPVVGEVFENSAAAKAGIVANDRILTINGNKIDSFDDIRKEVDLTVGNEVVVELLRDGREIRLQFPLIEMEVPEANGEMTKRPMLGVKSVNVIELDHEKLSLPQSLKEAFLEAWNVTEATLRGVGQMITGKRSGEEIGGIIRIAEMSV